MNSQYFNQESLSIYARRNWRGVSSNDLLYSILDVKEKLRALDEGDFDYAIGFQCPSGCSPDEWIRGHKIYFLSAHADALRELQRRRKLNIRYPKQPDSEIIRAIKDSVRIADVIEWYTEVIYANRDTWKYRCTLHGDGIDKDASGVIYNKEGRYWCYVCNKGGDCFDAVQAFEHCDLPEAIKKLANFVGIELAPLIQKKLPPVTGGIPL